MVMISEIIMKKLLLFDFENNFLPIKIASSNSLLLEELLEYLVSKCRWAEKVEAGIFFRYISKQ